MIFILGIEHHLQEYDLVDVPRDLERLTLNVREHFHKIVETICKAKTIRRIAEECKLGQKTIPQALAEELSIEYVEMDMPPDVRRKNSIAPDYERRPEERLRGFQLREDYMIREAFKGFDSRDGILLICGANHIEGLRDRCGSYPSDMDIRDLTAEDWMKSYRAERKIRELNGF